ncbi:ABC transporter permease [Falsochrobactrum shanghaiense]|nr:iron ABC transporter permease [Falsochrobactrum shanghaiense]
MAQELGARPMRSMGLSKWWTDGGALLTLTLLIFAGLILLPLFSLITEAFTDNSGRLTFMNFIRALQSRYNLNSIINTLALSGAVALISLALSAIFSFGVTRTRMWGKGLFHATVLISIISPGFLIAFAYVLLFGPNSGFINVAIRDLLGLETLVGPFNIYSLTGFVLLSVPMGIGICSLQLIPSLTSLDSSMEEASRIAGAGPVSTLFRVTFPIISPALFSGFILTFTLTLATYGTAQVLGINVLSISIRQSLLVVDDMKEASVLSVLATVIAVIAVIIYRRSIRAQKRYETVGHRGARNTIVDIGSWRHVLTVMTFIYTFFACILPYATLIYVSLLKATSLGFSWDNITFDHYTGLVTDAFTRNALVNSLILSSVSAFIVVILGLVCGYILVRTKATGRDLVDYIAILPLGLAGTAFGIAVLVTYLNPPFQFLGLPGTLSILVLAYVAHYVSFGVRGIQTALMQISTELSEAARMTGASKFKTLLDVDLPLIGGAIISVAALVFVLCFPELSMSIMLRSVDTQVVSTALLGRWEGEGGLQGAAAMAVLMFALIAVSLGLIYAATIKRKK